MIELENSLLPNLTKYITFWKRYVDDTICFVKTDTTEFIIFVLNSFDKNIQFTFEEGNDETIPFLKKKWYHNNSIWKINLWWYISKMEYTCTN